MKSSHCKKREKKLTEICNIYFLVFHFFKFCIYVCLLKEMGFLYRFVFGVSVRVGVCVCVSIQCSKKNCILSRVSFTVCVDISCVSFGCLIYDIHSRLSQACIYAYLYRILCNGFEQRKKQTSTVITKGKSSVALVVMNSHFIHTFDQISSK